MAVRTLFLTVKVEVDVKDSVSLLNDEIVSELDYNFSSFDENVKVIDTEIIECED